MKNIFRNILMARVVLSLNCAPIVAYAMPEPVPAAQNDKAKAAAQKKKEAEKRKKAAEKAKAQREKQKAAEAKKREADKKKAATAKENAKKQAERDKAAAERAKAAEERARGDAADHAHRNLPHRQLRHAQEPDDRRGRVSHEIL